DLAFTGGMIRVIAHQGGQIERNRESTAAVFQQIFVALVCFLRGSKARELPHREKFSPISRGVYAASEGRLSGIAEILVVTPVLGQIPASVEPADRNAGDRREPGAAMFVKVDPGRRSNRFLR